MSQRPSVDSSEREWAPAGIDPSVPHAARMYDWWLGGKDNFAADREMAGQIARALPTARAMARANRDFMHRATRYLARAAGLRQFLDIGTGIPTHPNLHEIAQEVAPHTRVVYVDNDPIVLVHARALMVGGELGATAYLHADLRDADRILDSAEVARTLDLTEPVGLVLAAILMLQRDEDDPWASVRTLTEALPAGSHLAISHPTHDFDPPAMAAVVAAGGQGGFTFVPRTRDEVARFFDGWELVEPGVVPGLAWHPDGPPPADPKAAYFWAGVARKP